MNKVKLIDWDALPDHEPTAVNVGDVELVMIRDGERVHVLHARCPHRAAHLAEGSVEGEDLRCPLHGWDFRLASGESQQLPGVALERFEAWLQEGCVCVDGDAIGKWAADNPSAFIPGEFDPP